MSPTLSNLENYPHIEDDAVWDLSRRILSKDILLGQAMDELSVKKELFIDVIKSLREQYRRYRNKYYRTANGEGVVNPLYLDHYMALMYYFSRRLFLEGCDHLLLDQIFFSIKSRAAMDLYYELDIPEYFYPLHCYGTVLGRAQYNKYFVIRQNCTVGNNHGHYPKFGEGVVLRPHSMVLGKCSIGNNVQIAAGALVIDTDIPDNSIVFGTPSNQIVKNNTVNNIKLFFPHA